MADRTNETHPKCTCGKVLHSTTSAEHKLCENCHESVNEIKGMEEWRDTGGSE